MGSDTVTKINSKAGLWLVLVFVVCLLSTALYVAINGWSKWTGDMQTGANYMLAAGGATQADRTLQILQPVPVAKKTVVAKQAGQFVCPVCGSTGLPDYAENGDPVCQVCGHKMDVIYFK
jgi:hypothetical protein